MPSQRSLSHRNAASGILERKIGNIYGEGGGGMAPDPFQSSRQKPWWLPALHPIDAEGHFNDVLPPFHKFLDPPLQRVLSLSPALSGATYGDP